MFCSSSHLSQFFQLSQLAAAIYQFLFPSSKRAEQLNNFSIYMHGGMEYQSCAFRHKCTLRARHYTNDLRFDPHSWRSSVCDNVLSLSGSGRRDSNTSTLPWVHLLFCSSAAAGHCCMTGETVPTERRNSMYNVWNCTVIPMIMPSIKSKGIPFL